MIRIFVLQWLQFYDKYCMKTPSILFYISRKRPSKITIMAQELNVSDKMSRNERNRFVPKQIISTTIK
jgi:hypothetical protein